MIHAPKNLIARVLRFIPQALRREDGTASMEFVLVIPLLMGVFMASFESGLMMTRSIMLEQAVDMTMRELRLGHYPNATNAVLKKEICSRTVIFPDCENNIKLELERVSTDDWALPRVPQHCINKRQEIDPVISLNVNQQNDLMLVRVCIALPAMFPSTGLALGLNLDSDGEYGLVATSAFVTEPS